MFKKIVGKTISMLEKATNELKRAYEETYPENDFELAIDFREEVNKRKEHNKQKLIQIMTDFVIGKILQDENYLIPHDQAEKIAKQMFVECANKGCIDELNRYITD